MWLLITVLRPLRAPVVYSRAHYVVGPAYKKKEGYRYFGLERRAGKRGTRVPVPRSCGLVRAGDVENGGTGTVNFRRCWPAQVHRCRGGSGDVGENGLRSGAGRRDGWRSPAKAHPGKAAADRPGLRQGRDHPHATAAVGADAQIDAKD